MNMTLAKAAELESRFSKGNWDVTATASELEFRDFNRLKMKDRGAEYKMLPSAKRPIAHRLRLPAEYLERCPKNLQAENLNYGLAQERKQREALFLRFNGRKDVRAVFTDRYTAIDNREVLSKMLAIGFRAEQEIQFMLDDGLMVVKVPEYANVFEVAAKGGGGQTAQESVGHVLEAGVEQVPAHVGKDRIGADDLKDKAEP